MKKLFFLLWLCIQYSFTAEAAKVAFIDLQEVERKSTAMQRITQNISTISAAIAADFSNQEAKLKEMETILIMEKGKIKEQEYENKVSKFHEEVSRVQLIHRERGTRLEKAGVEAMQKVQVTLNSIVQEVALQQGFSAVMLRAALVYADEKLNITDKVVEMLNLRIPEISVDY